MSRAPVTLGLVGAGGIGQSYAEALQTSALVQVCGVADTDPERAQRAAGELDCPVYDSADALAEAGCDAVVVCTPPSTHAGICLALLERGVHVLCEKPLAISTDTALEMVAAARRNDVILTMASKFRYVDDVIRAKRIVDSGILGEIILFENAFTSRTDMARRWNADRTVSGGGVLIDNGTHSVDIIRYFLGPIASVLAVEGRRAQPIAVEDTAQMFVRSAEDVMGTIDLSWSIDKERSTYVDVHGTHGTIRVGWQESRYRQAGNSDWVRFGKPYRKLDALRRQVDNFAGAILGTEQLLITAEDAIASVEVIEAAYVSMERSTWQPVANGVRLDAEVLTVSGA